MSKSLWGWMSKIFALSSADCWKLWALNLVGASADGTLHNRPCLCVLAVSYRREAGSIGYPRTPCWTRQDAQRRVFERYFFSSQLMSPGHGVARYSNLSSSISFVFYFLFHILISLLEAPPALDVGWISKFSLMWPPSKYVCKTC